MKKEFNLKQKLKFIKTEGNILSFVHPELHYGYKQIITSGKVEKCNGLYRIIGSHRDSAWASSWEDLVAFIDWNDWATRLDMTDEINNFNSRKLEKNDQFYIRLAREEFGSAVRDNSKTELISMGKAIDNGTIDSELL